MDIVVKCRRSVVTERFRQHVADKLAKLERLDPKVISVEVEVIWEPNPRLSAQCHRVELTCRRRGPVIRAEASAEDVHAALDAAFGKLEERFRRAADRRRVHHGSRAPQSVSTALAGAALTEGPDEAGPGAADAQDRITWAAAGADGLRPADLAAVAAQGSAAEDDLADDDFAEEDSDGDAPGAVREKRHASVPMTMDQALHEMELVGHDFFLYWDVDAGTPSVVYHRRGYRYGVLRLEAATAQA